MTEGGRGEETGEFHGSSKASMERNGVHSGNICGRIGEKQARDGDESGGRGLHDDLRGTGVIETAVCSDRDLHRIPNPTTDRTLVSN